MDCRGRQIEALQVLLTTSTLFSAISLHGSRGTGKTTVLRQFLRDAGLVSSWVQCDQCMTARVLLQRALRHIFDATKTGSPEDAVCENIDIFLSLISRKFRQANFTDQHILVLDRIDQLPEQRAALDMFSCLSRVHELEPGLTNLVVIFVSSSAEPQALIANASVPRVWFPRYTNEEAMLLLKKRSQELENPPIHDSTKDNAAEVLNRFKEDFLELVFNALSPSTGADISHLKRVSKRIWPQFINGIDPLTDSVAKVYVKKQHLFSADQAVDKLEVSTTSDLNLQVSSTASYLLCAAYLASYNSPRYDMRYFSLAKTMRNKRRETKPKKSVTIPARSLAPPAFEMERLLAIFHAIHPNAVAFQPTNEVGRELSTLEAQNLITKSQGDPLDSRTKWKINITWSYVQRLASEIGFSIEDYLVES